MIRRLAFGDSNIRPLAVPLALVFAVVGVLVGNALGWVYVIGVIALLALMFIGLRDSRWIVLSILIVFAVNQTTLFGGSPTTQTIRWVVLGFAAFVGIFRMMSAQPPRRFMVHDLPALLFLGLCLSSATYSEDPALTMQRAVSLVFLYLAVFWMGWDCVNRHDEESILRLLLISAAVIYGASAVYSFFPDAWQTDGRFRGVLPNPNSIGLLTAIYLPLLLWAWRKHRSVWTLLLLTLAVTALVLSQSRNGALSAAVALAFLASRIRTSSLVAAAVIVLPVVTIIYFSTDLKLLIESVPVIERFTEEVGDDFSSGRLQSWKSVLSQIEARPLMGYGFGVDAIGLMEIGSGRNQSLGAHNTYLSALYQTGIVGAGLTFGPLFALLISSLRKSRIWKGVQQEHVLQAVLIAGLMSAIFETWMFAVGNAFAFPFWICVMMLLREQTRAALSK